jgi:CubicO group peptidase (beta-lactamase class C family)
MPGLRVDSAPLASFPATLAVVLAAATSAGCAGATTHPTVAVASVTSPPASGWLQYAAPESAGFSAERLDVARRYADSLRSGAVMVVQRGVVVAAWGDVARKLEVHSVRKNIVSALYGIAVDADEIDIDRTLGDLGITDREPLTPVERSARIRDLLAARSGVYLPAAYADASQDTERPPRGSHAPNTNFFYNNWDFNALGVIYESVVDSSLYRSIAERLARPLGMQDYVPEDGYLVYEPTKSNHPAHTIRMSARDLARFGQLYLQRGQWNGRQVLSPGWTRESTSPKTTFDPGEGYGYLWWTRAPGAMGARYPLANRHAMYYGTGTGGQLVLVVPSEELVIVHRGDTDHDRRVAGRDVWGIVELILGARTGTPAPTAPRVALTPVPFASQLPPVPAQRYIAIDSALMAELAGHYRVAPNVIVRLFSHAGGLFGNFPGMGEAELSAVSRSELVVRTQPAIPVSIDRDATGRVTGFSAQMGQRRVQGVKQ